MQSSFELGDTSVAFPFPYHTVRQAVKMESSYKAEILVCIKPTKSHRTACNTFQQLMFSGATSLGYHSSRFPFKQLGYATCADLSLYYFKVFKASTVM